MLKIAEYNKITGKKIELSELEQFGFKYTNVFNEKGLITKENAPNLLWYSKQNNNFEYVDVNYLTREIKATDLCLLYDLIKSGYVEKVEE